MDDPGDPNPILLTIIFSPVQPGRLPSPFFRNDGLLLFGKMLHDKFRRGGETRNK